MNQTARTGPLLAIVLLGLQAGATIAAADQLGALLDDVEASWRADLAKERVVGAGLVILAPDRRVALWHHGDADRAADRPVADDTIWHWASVTKTFTAVAVMQLVERGLIGLDDPALAYLPELRSVHNEFGEMSDITIRHLLSHSSGFRGPTWPWGGTEPWHPHEPRSWRQIVAMLPYTEIGFEPGSRFGYSNLGTVILGQIVEVVTGDDIEVYLTKNVLMPLGMEHSYFDTTPWYLAAHRSHGYYIEEDAVRSIGADFDTGITVANGGLNAPIADMEKFVRFVAGTAPPVETPVLRRETLQSMFEPLHPVATDEYREISIGLGFFIVDNLAPGTGDRVRWVGHSGFQLTHRSFIYIEPNGGFAAISAANSVNRDTGNPSETNIRIRLLNEVFPLLTGASRQHATESQ